MNYEVMINGEWVAINNVNEIVDADDRLTFFDSDNRIIAEVNKARYEIVVRCD